MITDKDTDFKYFCARHWNGREQKGVGWWKSSEKDTFRRQRFQPVVNAEVLFTTNNTSQEVLLVGSS